MSSVPVLPTTKLSGTRGALIYVKSHPIKTTRPPVAGVLRNPPLCIPNFKCGSSSFLKLRFEI